MKTYARGQDDAAVLYLEPAREKGTKMLREEDFDIHPDGERIALGIVGSDARTLVVATDFFDELRRLTGQASRD